MTKNAYTFKGPVNMTFDASINGCGWGSISGDNVDGTHHVVRDDEVLRASQALVNEYGADLATHIDIFDDRPVTSAIVSISSLGAGGLTIAVTSSRELSEQELEELKEDLLGQMSDGFGEGFEQQILVTYDNLPCRLEDGQCFLGGGDDNADLAVYLKLAHDGNAYRLGLETPHAPTKTFRP